MRTVSLVLKAVRRLILEMESVTLSATSRPASMTVGTVRSVRLIARTSGLVMGSVTLTAIIKSAILMTATATTEGA
jgi:hypothetical protein